MSNEEIDRLIRAFAKAHKADPDTVLEFANVMHGIGYTEGLARGMAHGKAHMTAWTDKEASYGTTH